MLFLSLSLLLLFSFHFTTSLKSSHDDNNAQKCNSVGAVPPAPCPRAVLQSLKCGLTDDGKVVQWLTLARLCHLRFSAQGSDMVAV